MLEVLGAARGLFQSNPCCSRDHEQRLAVERAAFRTRSEVVVAAGRAVLAKSAAWASARLSYLPLK